MTRSRKTAEATGEPQQTAADEVIGHAQATLGAEVVKEPSPFPAEQPTQPGTAHAARVQKKPFQVVRGFHIRNKPPVQFRRLHDADLGIIVFKFVLPKDEQDKERMPADIKDILDAHKKYPETGDPTGLHFENNRKHGKAWILPMTRQAEPLRIKWRMPWKSWPPSTTCRNSRQQPAEELPPKVSHLWGQASLETMQRPGGMQESLPAPLRE